MKMKKEHYDVLKQHILDTIPKMPSLEAYKENGLSDQRYRWDLLHKSGLKIGDGAGMSGIPLYAYMNDDNIDTALRHILKNNTMNDIDEINDIRSRAGLLELKLPELNSGDEMMVGKFKNRKATINGFTTDKNNQPIAKTDKGDQQIFKGRIKKLMDEPQTDPETIEESKSTLVNTQIHQRDNLQMKQLNEINDIRMRAGLPIMEDTEDMDEMLRVLRALKGAYMALSQIKTDLEDDHLVSRMGMNNGEYLNSTVGDQLAEISEVLSRYSNYVKDESTKDESEAEDIDDGAVYSAPEYEETTSPDYTKTEPDSQDDSSEENKPDEYSASEDTGEPSTPEYEKIGENTSAGGMGAGAIGSSVVSNKKGNSSFHDLVRKNEKEAKCKGGKPKKIETIFAISDE